MAEGSHFNQQGQHVYGPQNNAKKIINYGADPRSIADGMALDRQRQRDALASQQAWQDFEQHLQRQRHMEEAAARRASNGKWVAIGVGSCIALFMAYAIMLDIVFR